MTHYAVIGILAGLVSTVLYLAVTAGNFLAVILFYMAPLPLYIAGLGWGSLCVLIGGGVGLILTLIVTSVEEAGLFLAIIVVPTTLLSHVALLNRSDEGTDSVEWYPTGRILVWIAVLGGCLAVAFAAVLNMTATESFIQAFKSMLRQSLEVSGLLEQGANQLDDEKLSRLVDFLVRAIPPASAFFWMIITSSLMCLAAAIVRRSGFGSRPRDKYTHVSLPLTSSFILGIAFCLMLLGEFLGVIGMGFLTAFAVAFMLQGLAVLHVLTEKHPLRILILGTTYLIILFTSWVGILVVAAIGLAETAIGLRARFAPPS